MRTKRQRRHTERYSSGGAFSGGRQELGVMESYVWQPPPSRQPNRTVLILRRICIVSPKNIPLPAILVEMSRLQCDPGGRVINEEEKLQSCSCGVVPEPFTSWHCQAKRG